MHTIPHTLHFVTGDRPSQLVQDRIGKISSLHPNWTVHHWTDSAPPEGGRLSVYYGKANSGAELADLMRIDAIWKYGGIYIDSDFVIERPLDPIADNHQFFIASEDGDFPTNALFGAVAGHAALDALIDTLLKHEPDWTQPANKATGPHFFKRICQWRSDVDVLPRETFYPYGWADAPRAAHRLSYGIHLWDGSWMPDEKEQRSASTSSPDRSLKARVQIEVAKFLSTVGFEKAGTALWNSAHGIVDHRPGLEETKVGSYTVGEDVFVHTTHETILICDGRDLSITPHLVLLGHYELTEELFLKRTLVGGDWYVDVGANIGNHAILAATRVGPFGRVFAFEPNERCSTLMRKASVVNWVHDRLKIQELGISDAVGDAQLTFSATQLGGAAIDTGAPQSDCLDATLAALGDGQTMTIGTTTLDAAFPVNLPIKVLKIDAEGHEPAIFRGGSRLLSNRAVDYILVEAIMELAGTRWHEHLAAYRRLIDFGYKPARLNPDGSLKPHESLDEALRDDASRTIVFYVPV